jgi:hypothetical protein
MMPAVRECRERTITLRARDQSDRAASLSKLDSDLTLK